MFKSNMPVTSVAVPALSRLQDDPARYRRFFAHGILLATSLSMPLVAGLFLISDELLPLALGEGWDQAVILFQILAITAFCSTFTMAAAWAYQSCGAVGAQLRMTAITSVLLVIGFLIGANWGPEGVAAALGIGSVLRSALFFYDCFKRTIPTFADLWRGMGRPTTASLASLGIMLGIDHFLIGPERSVEVSTIVELLILGGGFSILYGVVWLIIPGSIGVINELKATAKLLKPAAKNTQPSTTNNNDAHDTARSADTE
jgi:PST family polysaccharide transporter